MTTLSEFVLENTERGGGDPDVQPIGPHTSNLSLRLP